MTLPDLKSQATWLQQARKKNEMGEQAVSDRQIMESLIQQHPEVAQPYNRLRQSTKDHPLAATKFLNYAFYGDANYQEPKSQTKQLSLNGLVEQNEGYMSQSDPSRYSTQDLQQAIGSPDTFLGAIGSGIKGGIVGTGHMIYNAGKSAVDAVNNAPQMLVGAAALPAGAFEEVLARKYEPFTKKIFGEEKGAAPKTWEREQFMGFMKATGLADILHGATVRNPDQVLTGIDTALNFGYQHPLETAMAAEGGARGINKMTGEGGIKVPVPSEMGGKIVGKVGEVAGSTVNKIPGVQGAKDFMANRTAKIEATKSANAAYQQEVARPKTADDLSTPARSTAMDVEAAKNGTAIIENGKIIGYKPNAEIASTLKKVVTDPNNVPQALGEIQNAKGTLSQTARAELTKQTAGKINEFQTKRYQDAATKSVRKTLSDAMQTDESRIAFDESEIQKVQQKATIVENKYSEFLRQSGGEAEIAKLDLRQWLDKQIPDSAYSKSLAELPVATRSLIVFRRALSASIDATAKSLGGKYGTLMKEISNLYKAEETVSSHIPKPETLMERYKVPGEQKLPNEVPPSVGQMVTAGAKKLVKPALKGAGFGFGTHLIP